MSLAKKLLVNVSENKASIDMFYKKYDDLFDTLRNVESLIKEVESLHKKSGFLTQLNGTHQVLIHLDSVRKDYKYFVDNKEKLIDQALKEE